MMYPTFPTIGVRFAHIPGFPGYAASDDGRIWSCRAGRKPGALLDHWVERSTHVDRWGYAHLSLYAGGKRRGTQVHPLILTAFVGPCPDGYEAAHDNGIRTDNRLLNLSWKTPQANAADRVRHGTHRQGTAVNTCVLAEDDVRAIRQRIRNGDIKARIAADYGVSPSTVSWIASGKTWKHIDNTQEAQPC